MGAILSCCCETESSELNDGDRAPLFNEDEAYMPSNSHDIADTDHPIDSRPEGDCSFMGSVTSTVGSLQGQYRTVMEQRQREEEKALQNILEVMSKQFVDMEGYQAHVNNLVQQQAAHAEPAFVQERAREYGKRLQKAAHAICLKHAAASTTAGSPSEPGAATTTGSAPMADLSGSKAELEKVLYGQVISDSDAMLVSEVSARAQEAIIDFKIELLEEVLVPLDHHQTSQQDQSQHHQLEDGR